jgi:hypothetical protein
VRVESAGCSSGCSRRGCWRRLYAEELERLDRYARTAPPD